MGSLRDIQRAAPVLAGRRKKSWYRRWWGMLLLCFFALLVVYGVVLGAMTYRIYKTMQSGGGTAQGFTEARMNHNQTEGGAPLVVPGAPRFGPDNAQISIVEFGDFQCPFTKQAFSVMRQLMNEYTKQSVQFVWRDFPITDIHPDAQLAAEAGRCAHEQGKFWEYHDMLFLNQSDLSREALVNYAERVGANRGSFVACLDSHRYKDVVDRDMQDGWANGIHGTPTFFINGRKVQGVIPHDLFARLIERLFEVIK